MSGLTTIPLDPLLDLDPWVGQRSCTFRFALSNGVTGEQLGDITPIRGASLTHNTTQTVKRSLTMALGVADTERINPITDRIDLFMVFPGQNEYPLGRYMFTNFSDVLFTSGRLGSVTLTDEMFLVDQQITAGINAVGFQVEKAIQNTLSGLPIKYTLESSQYSSVESWALGANRGQILEALAVSGDYFSPWFGNDTELHFIRTFEAATRVPDLDFDAGNKVLRSGITEENDLLTTPNTFIVVSNASEDAGTPVIGTATIPFTSPHSVANRGFVFAQVLSLQLATSAQATAVAKGLANRQNVFQRVNLTTAPDPRHDSYNVIRWQGENWLELSWSMALVEGGTMNHLLRKAIAF